MRYLFYQNQDWIARAFLWLVTGDWLLVTGDWGLGISS